MTTPNDAWEREAEENANRLLAHVTFDLSKSKNDVSVSREDYGRFIRCRNDVLTFVAFVRELHDRIAVLENGDRIWAENDVKQLKTIIEQRDEIARLQEERDAIARTEKKTCSAT